MANCTKIFPKCCATCRLTSVLACDIIVSQQRDRGLVKHATKPRRVCKEVKQGLKKKLKNFEKRLDKPSLLWYNKDTEKERDRQREPTKKNKKSLENLLTNLPKYGIIRL